MTRIGRNLLIAVGVVSALLLVGGVGALIKVISDVSDRAEKVARAAAYQQWTDCIEDLTDTQEAAFEERLADFLAAAFVRNDYGEAAAIVADLDAIELTPTPHRIREACGEQPPKAEL